MAAPNTNGNMILQFKVKDFNAWRMGYEGHQNDRASAGITNGRVFCGADDGNDVLVLQDVFDASKAHSWLDSKEMKAACEKSGVLGLLNIRFVPLQMQPLFFNAKPHWDEFLYWHDLNEFLSNAQNS